MGCAEFRAPATAGVFKGRSALDVAAAGVRDQLTRTLGHTLFEQRKARLCRKPTAPRQPPQLTCGHHAHTAELSIPRAAVQVLGQGGYGTVWLARRRRTGM